LGPDKKGHHLDKILNIVSPHIRIHLRLTHFFRSTFTTTQSSLQNSGHYGASELLGFGLYKTIAEEPTLNHRRECFICATSKHDGIEWRIAEEGYH
jgi:hypothetical protein